MVSLRRLAAILVGCSAIVLFVSCQARDPLGRRPISGTVTFNGAPLEEGSISFQPLEQGTTSSGAMIRLGKYAITRDKGLPPGKYRVVINAIKPGTGTYLPEGKMPGEEVGTPPVELIPAAWNTSSKNTIEVSADQPTNYKHEIVTNAK